MMMLIGKKGKEKNYFHFFVPVIRRISYAFYLTVKLRFHKTGGNMNSVAVSSNGLYVAAGGEDRKVYFMNSEGKLLWSFDSGAAVRSIVISRDGTYVAVGDANNYVYLFDSEGKTIWSRKTGSLINCVSMTPYAYYVAAGGSNYNVYLFDRKGGFSWMHNPGYWVSSVSLTTNGEYLAAGSFDDKVYLFNRTGEKLWDFKAKDDVYAVEISADSSFIAAGSWDDNLYVLNMDGEELWNYSCGGNINSLDVSRDSTTIAVGSDAGAVYLFERNPTAFALLLGDESFLPEETATETDTSLAKEIIKPIEETAVTGGVENKVEDAPATSSSVSGNAKTGENPGSEELPTEESSLKLLEKFDSIKFPAALLLGALAGTVFFLKRRLVKYHEKNDENLEDFEDLEEKDIRNN